ncbi:MAG: hypothetical protein JXB36_07135 [Gammaproteobacteria bacterium]|nr:hypothetical protein [Gammaproteobacteria bacterium]
MTRRLLGLTCLVPLACIAGAAQAHHSVSANFDLNRRIEIRGTVVDFKLRSPHSSLVVRGRAFENGAPLDESEQDWEIESSALKGLASRGITADSITPGDTIIVVGSPHRRGLHRANSSEFLAADRSPLGSVSGGAAERDPASLVPPGLVAAERVTGRWRPPYQPEGKTSALPLNEAGLAAWRSYDQALSPANTCEPMSIPVVFNAPSYFVDIRFGDGNVVIRNEAYDVHRTVPLGSEFAPADPDGQWGRVRGRVEGDTLVVESRDYPPSKWGLGAATQINGGGADVPSSERKTVTERFSVSDDALTLIYEYTLFDPAYMREPHDARIEMARVSDDSPMYPYDCDVDSASMFSRAPEETLLERE